MDGGESRSEIDQFVKPLMVDPSILVSKDRLQRLYEYEGVLYIPSSFKKLFPIKEKESLRALEFYAGYLQKEKLAYYDLVHYNEALRSLFEKENVKEFSKESVEIPREVYPHLRYLKEIELPIEVKRIIEEELIFLYTQSGLISRLKKIFEIFGDLRLPMIDATHSVPEEWRSAVRGMKKICNWTAFLANVAMTANHLHTTPILLVINGVTLIIIDP